MILGSAVLLCVAPLGACVEKSSSLPGTGEIAFSELPPEAQAVVEAIRQGGPFPYDKDGATFYNREGLLPHARRGYYREYTVVTPGVAGRGARRIVSGAGGELYYTADHYRSFKRIRR